MNTFTQAQFDQAVQNAVQAAIAAITPNGQTPQVPQPTAEAESVAHEAPLNRKGDPIADANDPQTWTAERVGNTPGRGTGRTTTLEAIAGEMGFNGINVLEIKRLYDANGNVKPLASEHIAYGVAITHHELKPTERLRQVILDLLATNPAPVPVQVAPVANVIPAPDQNAADIARLQAELRTHEAEVEQINAMLAQFPQMGVTVHDRQVELATMIDSLHGELSELQTSRTTAEYAANPYAQAVGITPEVGKQVARQAKQASTIAQWGRANPKAWGENMSTLRRPSVLKARYETAQANAKAIKAELALADTMLATPSVKGDDEAEKAIRDMLKERTGKFGDEHCSGAVRKGTIDKHMLLQYLIHGERLPNPVWGDIAPEAAYERKAAGRDNMAPKKAFLSRNAKKAAKTRKANA